MEQLPSAGSVAAGPVWEEGCWRMAGEGVGEAAMSRAEVYKQGPACEMRRNCWQTPPPPPCSRYSRRGGRGAPPPSPAQARPQAHPSRQYCQHYE